MKTKQRAAILAYLYNNTSHPSAKQIYEAVSKQMEGISLATVYNALSSMKKKGLVREIAATHEEHKRYDANVSPHAHLICSGCSRIIDVHLPFSVEIPEAQKQGFDIWQSAVNFYGRCPQCQEKDRKPFP